MAKFKRKRKIHVREIRLIENAVLKRIRNLQATNCRAGDMIDLLERLYAIDEENFADIDLTAEYERINKIYDSYLNRA